MASINTVLLLGKPASGKGTQAKLLAQKRGWRHVATGDHLRLLARRQDDVGARVQKALASARLLPDGFMTHLLYKVLMDTPSDRGLVLDGFARTVSQAKEFDEVMKWFGRPYVAILLDVPDEVATRRMLARSTQEQRKDSDTQEKILQRLEDYKRESARAGAFFADLGLLSGMYGGGSPEIVHRAISAVTR